MNRKLTRGFSLIEVLAAVAIIGIITFLALPNIVTLKQDAEIDLAISRAQSVNMAIAAYVQANGQTTAASNWTGNDQAKWVLISPFLAFAPTNLSDFAPSNYTIEMPPSIQPLAPSTLKDPNNVAINY